MSTLAQVAPTVALPPIAPKPTQAHSNVNIRLLTSWTQETLASPLRAVTMIIKLVNPADRQCIPKLKFATKMFSTQVIPTAMHTHLRSETILPTKKPIMLWHHQHGPLLPWALSMPREDCQLTPDTLAVSLHVLPATTTTTTKRNSYLCWIEKRRSKTGRVTEHNSYFKVTNDSWYQITIALRDALWVDTLLRNGWKFVVDLQKHKHIKGHDTLIKTTNLPTVEVTIEPVAYTHAYVNNNELHLHHTIRNQQQPLLSKERLPPPPLVNTKNDLMLMKNLTTALRDPPEKQETRRSFHLRPLFTWKECEEHLKTLDFQQCQIALSLELQIFITNNQNFLTFSTMPTNHQHYFRYLLQVFLYVRSRVTHDVYARMWIQFFERKSLYLYLDTMCGNQILGASFNALVYHWFTHFWTCFYYKNNNNKDKDYEIAFRLLNNDQNEAVSKLMQFWHLAHQTALHVFSRPQNNKTEKVWCHGNDTFEMVKRCGFVHEPTVLYQDSLSCSQCQTRVNGCMPWHFHELRAFHLTTCRFYSPVR